MGRNPKIFPHKTAQKDTIPVPKEELSCANIVANEIATIARQSTQNHSNTETVLLLESKVQSCHSSTIVVDYNEFKM